MSKDLKISSQESEKKEFTKDILTFNTQLFCGRTEIALLTSYSYKLELFNNNKVRGMYGCISLINTFYRELNNI